MNRLFKKERLAACLFLVFFAGILHVAVAYAETAGTFIFVRGKVWIIDSGGDKSGAKKGDLLSEGDTLVTEKNGYCQVLMADKGYMAIRPGTRLQIDTFQYRSPNEEDDKGIFSLMKGGFRAITGIIGKKNKENYKIKTPVATIGIRGTDHEPMFIPISSEKSMAAATPGAYDKVNEGEAYIENEAGMITIGKNQVGFTPDADTPPERLTEMPGFYKQSPTPEKADGKTEREDAADDEGETQEETEKAAADTEDETQESDTAPDDAADDSDTEADASTTTTDDTSTSEESGTLQTTMADTSLDPVDTTPEEQSIDQAITSDDGSVDLTDPTTVTVSPYRIVGFATWDPRSPLPPHSLVEGKPNDPNNLSLTGSGDLLGFESRLPVIGGGDEAVRLDINSDYILTDTGAMPLDSGLGDVIWGRWHSSLSTPQNLATQLDSGADVSPAFAPQDLHYLAGPEMSTPVVLPTTGTISYTYAGGTTPTNHIGMTGTLNSASLTANFTDMTVDAGVSVTVDTVQLDAFANGIPIQDTSSGFTVNSDGPNFTAGFDDPTPLNVTCTGGGCGTIHDGTLAGGFMGDAGEGAGMAYSLNTTDNSTIDTSISGVAIFKK